jgi:murein DD-endopeptidase MepM/ murein hydrolase activator NlpD
MKYAADAAQFTRFITDTTKRARVDSIFEHYSRNVVPRMSRFRSSIIHGDANDLNTLASIAREYDMSGGANRVCALIDFGDVVQSHTIFDLAIALAYVVQRKQDPITAACHVISAYHRVLPISEPEIEVLYDLIVTRIAVSVTISAKQQAETPANAAYLRSNEQSGWHALEQLLQSHRRLVWYRFRDACGFEAHPNNAALCRALQSRADGIGRVVDVDFRTAQQCQVHIFDLERNSPLASAAATAQSVAHFTHVCLDDMRRASDGKALVGVGRYNEERAIYSTDSYTVLDDRRTRHIGIDLFVDAGAAVYAPLAGRIHSFANNSARLDYGPCIIVEHHIGDAGAGQLTFYTLYGHLSLASLATLHVGQLLEQGQVLGYVGNYPENGDWPPHLHFQVILDMLDNTGDFPGVAAKSQLATWLSLCPNPNVILGIPYQWLGAGGRAASAPPLPNACIEALRTRHLCRSLSTAYANVGALQLVRGVGSYLYDQHGNEYLDAVNNVCHVGHCHPRVVDAIASQARELNSNTRYLHQNLVQYIERLCATMPHQHGGGDKLEVCYLVCSASEANDLAMRLARAYTNKTDFIVVVCCRSMYLRLWMLLFGLLNNVWHFG